MSDRIEVRGLRVLGVIGVLPHERTEPQPLEIDLDLYVDLRAPGASDDLTDTVDYGAVTTMAVEVAAGPFDLLERLAERLAHETLRFEGVERVEVAVRKLRPPVAADVATTGVRIVRER